MQAFLGESYFLPHHLWGGKKFDSPKNARVEGNVWGRIKQT